MKKIDDMRHGRHCIFLMHAHLVFVTKYRRKAFNKEVIDFLGSVFAKVCKDFESELVEFDGESDHVHFAYQLPSKK
ncbi:hypothetical protein HPHPP41_0734 [Helicobacter pylori Hp P-41]|nr:hypothetical protein HPHPP41_0734 [Helicobacter pylori Hp P-41]